jgi:hypothetical protein
MCSGQKYVLASWWYDIIVIFRPFFLKQICYIRIKMKGNKRVQNGMGVRVAIDYILS